MNARRIRICFFASVFLTALFGVFLFFTYVLSSYVFAFMGTAALACSVITFMFGFFYL